MHIDQKYILVVTTIFLGVSGCQSGGSSSWKWWGAQNNQAVSPSELAGSPYDGVTLPSTQVAPPEVSEGEEASQRESLATVPPGTPTPNPYSVSGGPSASPSGKPTYPSTAYPNAPYTHSRPKNSGGPVGVASAQAPTLAQGGSPAPTEPRYPVTGFPGGNPQPRYPSTGFDANPVASQLSPPAVANPILASSTYGTKSKTPPQTAQTGFNPGASSMGPRYSTSSPDPNSAPNPVAQPVADPTNNTFPSNTATMSPRAIGPRYARLPGTSSGSRYDAQPASPQVNATPVQVAPTASPLAQPVPGNTAMPKQNYSPPNRYPSVPSVVDASPDTLPTRQVDFTPFQPGSTGRYVPSPDPVVTPPTSTGPSGANNFQPGTPYNPPAEERP